MYKNPLLDFNCPDPTIVRHHDGHFYLYSTEHDGKLVPIYHSKDLIQWDYVGMVFKQKPQWGTKGADLWAPEIILIEDTYVLYYALSTWGDENPGIGVATSKTPIGPWEDHGKLFDSESIGVNNSIDPYVYKDANQLYMIWGSMRGLYGVRLTQDGLALKDGLQAKQKKVLLAGLQTENPWNEKTYEAPYLLKRNSYYYLFVSSGTCCEGLKSTYHIRVARSKHPLGPYIDSDRRSMLGEDRGHIVIQGSDDFKGPGHHTMIKDDAGDDWILYHSYSLQNPLERQLMIDKLIWDSYGWPTVNKRIPSKQETPPYIQR